MQCIQRMQRNHIKGDVVVLIIVLNIVTLAALGFIDLVKYKIPNSILCGWILTYMVFLSNGYATPVSLKSRVIASLLVTGSYYLFRRIVKCNAGDFKFFGSITLISGISDSSKIVFIACLISLLPLAWGVKKVQLGLMAFFGYIAFLIIGW